VLLAVPDLREILSGTKTATLRLLSGAGRCGVRVVGKRVQEQIREAVPGQVLIRGAILSLLLKRQTPKPFLRQSELGAARARCAIPLTCTITQTRRKHIRRFKMRSMTRQRRVALPSCSKIYACGYS